MRSLPASINPSSCWAAIAGVVLACAMLLCVPLVAQTAGQQQQPPAALEESAAEDLLSDRIPAIGAVAEALVRLPLAALLGAGLALRPKRRGTPTRQPAVVQTQIMLAVVGALIMLVVGSSLARAFGIVGAANLIRYRSKIEDPKDAVVMLCALAVGLASGVGIYALAVFSTAFMVAALWVIESFEPETRKRFSLAVKAGEATDDLRPKIEEILHRYDCEFELRTSSDVEVCYHVQVPLELQTDSISNSILRLDPDGHAAVEWSEAKKQK
jgi:uncharacterized membrane protein YhiD involved in acid resistance